ncbi:MAG: DUF4403 family protein [Bacteroidales bacterium]|nr:DUF4403 family protein [Bacteroidales bacterium]
MKKIKFVLFSVIAIFLLHACKVQLENTMPEFVLEQPQRTEVVQSFISLPIQIPLNVIENEVNRQFAGTIYEDMDYDIPEKDDVKVRIWKTRDIRLQAYNEYVRFDVPVGIWAKYRWKACDFCPQIEKETNFNIFINFTSKIEVKNDWRIEFKTLPTGLRFETTPRLDFGVISIPITSIVEPIVKEQLSLITQDIDNEMEELLNLNKTMDSVWQALQEPQLLDSSYNAWLSVTPTQALLSPLRSNNEGVKIFAGFRGIIKVVLGEKPIVNNFSSLPLITLTEQIGNEFSIFIESFMNFDAATDIARRHLKDTILEINTNRSVKIDDISFMGFGSKIYTKVVLSRSINGTVYFIGTPAYNRETKEIYFADFDYDLRSKNALFKSADWILHGTFKRTIEKQFRYNVTDDFNEIKILVDKSLMDYDFDGIFTLNGRLDSLDIHDVFVEPNGLRLIIDAKGRSKIKINSLEY